MWKKKSFRNERAFDNCVRVCTYCWGIVQGYIVWIFFIFVWQSNRTDDYVLLFYTLHHKRPIITFRACVAFGYVAFAMHVLGYYNIIILMLPQVGKICRHRIKVFLCCRRYEIVLLQFCNEQNFYFLYFLLKIKVLTFFHMKINFLDKKNQESFIKIKNISVKIDRKSVV